MLTVNYCPVCYERIENYGELAISIYQLVCELYVLDGKFLIHDSVLSKRRGFEATLKFLERKGEILSLDVENGLLIKPTAHRVVTEVCHQFCSCK